MSAEDSLSKGQAVIIQLDLQEAVWEIRPGLSTRVWSYGGTVPGTPIVVNQGETVHIAGINNLPVPTNIHWHGLTVPNDQDGPGRVLLPGQPFEYNFKVEEAGTYWYHSHCPPVLEQVDMGLYGPFISKSPEDVAYSGDHILVLDDWYLDPTGQRLEGSAGDMERVGNIETVNGKTGSAIAPLIFRKGELHKLRFINASTAAFHTLTIIGHTFRVTHTDGHPLVEPYETTTIALAPAERIDAEVAAIGQEGQSYTIESERSALGLNIPIHYTAEEIAPIASPFLPPPSKIKPGIYAQAPDFILELDSTMDMPAGTSHSPTAESPHSQMGHGMHGMSSMADSHHAPASHQTHSTGSMSGMMHWTINGKSYPNTDPLRVRVGQLVKVRFLNQDTKMMHQMPHPMHLHGTSFLIVSLNGHKP
ncbi:MAG TPA: multicopper oxidase family protein, partial [Anaerolineae bacterium]|nr:multicopper oxidase family protein [Anaerolineae bacterium]